MLEQHFDVEVVQAHTLQDTLEKLRQEQFDLVLINRKLDIDYSDGTRILEAIKADPQISSVPVMLITNYPEHQQRAIELGALPGFGKLALSAPETIERLSAVLSA
ncbi:MAG: response regulator [Planctomycetota bacterium]|nr:MAG: response regulator [Planctomycetota bacterium]